jgi:hypothetical protein
MSGGAYNHAHENLKSMANLLLIQDDPRRQAFARALDLVATAMVQIEAVDSGDALEGDEIKAVDRVLRRFLSFAEFTEVRLAAEAYQTLGKDHR